MTTDNQSFEIVEGSNFDSTNTNKGSIILDATGSSNVQTISLANIANSKSNIVIF